MTFTNLGLWLEFILLFVLIPIGFRFKPFPFPPIPALWILAAYCLFRLWHAPAFDRAKLWRPLVFPQYALEIFAFFAISVVVVGASVYFFAPQMLFNFVRRAPAFWALVMVLYPVLSVYPQGIVYRAFLSSAIARCFPIRLS